jgi:hypothetical protein
VLCFVYPATATCWTCRLTVDTDDEGEAADEPESEEDESNPHPLEGKYKDEHDRQQCALHIYIH